MFTQLLAVQLNENDLSLLRKVVGRIQVIAAGNSNEALHLMDQHASIDMVLIDIERSYLQSLQLLHTLVYRSQQEPLRIIVLGEPQLLQQKRKVFDLDIVTILDKPLQEKQLREVLEREVVKQDANSQQQNLQEQAHLFNAIFYQAPIGISISHRVDLGVEPGKERFDVNPMYEKKLQEEARKKSLGLDGQRLPILMISLGSWNISSGLSRVNWSATVWRNGLSARWLHRMG